MFKNVVFQRGNFMESCWPFLKYYRLLGTRLTTKSKWALGLLSLQNLTGAVRIIWGRVGSFFLCSNGRNRSVTGSRAQQTEVSASVKWTEWIEGWRGSCCGVRYARVCLWCVRGGGGCVCVWWLTQAQAADVSTSTVVLHIQTPWFRGYTWPSATPVPYD